MNKTYPTKKQRDAVGGMLEGKSVSRSMRDAGYAPKTAKNPKNLTESKAFKNELKPLLQRLEDERDKIVERLKKTRNKAKYRDLIDGLDKITKNIQLLSGGATSIEILELSDEKYKSIIKREAEKYAKRNLQKNKTSLE